MKPIRKTIFFIVLLLPLLSFSQQISNIRFEQAGKQIHIYYDLAGEGNYTVRVFCSTDNGQSWGNPLQKVSGAVGENQKAGKGKMIVWDVLNEREKLSGEILFKIEADTGKNVTFTDPRDGQTYKWVKIGKQVWMAENLNYKTGKSWCYENSSPNCNIYGRLYDWNTARNACPGGWHLPTDEEWKTLEMYLGMSQSEADDILWRGADEGGKLKEAGTVHWNSPNTGATNSFGFTALPGGRRFSSGSFYHLGIDGYWWSGTEHSGTHAWNRYLSSGSGQVGRSDAYKATGFSVRCLKN